MNKWATTQGENAKLGAIISHSHVLHRRGGSWRLLRFIRGRIGRPFACDHDAIRYHAQQEGGSSKGADQDDQCRVLVGLFRECVKLRNCIIEGLHYRWYFAIEY